MATTVCENVTLFDPLSFETDDPAKIAGDDLSQYAGIFNPISLPACDPPPEEHELFGWPIEDFSLQSDSMFQDVLSPATVLQGPWDESSLAEWSMDTPSSNSSYTYGPPVTEDLEPVAQPRLSCRTCREGFENAYSLEQHAKESGHRIFVCPVPGCGADYTRRDSWTRHKRTHKLELRCDLCPGGSHRKTFKRKDHLLAHVRNCHPQSNGYPDSSGLAKTQRLDDASSKSAATSPQERTGCRSINQGGAQGHLPAGQNASGSEYESRAVQDIVETIQRIHGDESRVLRALDERWKLNRGSTTEKVACILAEIALKPPSGSATC